MQDSYQFTGNNKDGYFNRENVFLLFIPAILYIVKGLT
mgnify:CR=1 FL=1